MFRAIIILCCVLKASGNLVNDSDVHFRVIGGEVANTELFPFQVSLRKRNVWNRNIQTSLSQDKHFCSGSILNSKWILTAAHCVDSMGFLKILYVVAGVGKLGEEQRIRVDKVFRHPDFNDRKMVNDIAMLRLREDLKYSNYVKNITLPGKFSEPSGGVIASGWGITETWRPSSTLRSTDRLEILSNHKCNLQGDWGKILDSQICVIPSNYGEKVDVCAGDSGGPLIQKKENGTEVIGIVSFGSPCRFAIADPGVYTKVSHFINWIDEVMKFESDCGPTAVMSNSVIRRRYCQLANSIGSVLNVNIG